MLIEWNDKKYGVGVAEIDSQHKDLVQMINYLHEEQKKGLGKEALGKLFISLEAYSNEHFSCEEDYLKNSSFLKEQQHEHEMFTKNLKNHLNNYEKYTFCISLDIMEFLRDWLTNHILGLDRKSFLGEQNEK